MHRREKRTRYECSVRSICLEKKKLSLWNKVFINTQLKYGDLKPETGARRRDRRTTENRGERENRREQRTRVFNLCQELLCLPQPVFLLGLLLNSLQMSCSAVCCRTGFVKIIFSSLASRCLSLYTH